MVEKKIYSMFSIVQLAVALMLAIGVYSQSFACAHKTLTSQIAISEDVGSAADLWINHPSLGNRKHNSGLPQYPSGKEDSDDDKSEEDNYETDAFRHLQYDLTVAHARLSVKFSSLRLAFIRHQTLVPLYVLFHSWKTFFI